MSDVRPFFRRPHSQGEDGEQKRTTQWFAVDWRRRTCAPEPNRGLSHLLQASTKGGLWHRYISAQAQNKLVSLAYRLTVQADTQLRGSRSRGASLIFTCDL